MASNILPAAPAAQYHLPEADRQALLALSDSSKKMMEIERQRQRFMRLNGSEFGLETQEVHRTK